MSEQKIDYPMPPGFYNADCMEEMKKFPDKFFDLAIVDPPYGGGGNKNAEKSIRGGEYRILNSASVSVLVGDSTGISANRTGGTWATKYRQRKMAVQI